MEKNYRVYYYYGGDLVYSHLLRYDHICFILEHEFRTSPTQMGCYFTFSKEECYRFCWFMTRFTCDKKRKLTYLNMDFVNYFTKNHNASIDVIRFANIDENYATTTYI